MRIINKQVPGFYNIELVAQGRYDAAGAMRIHSNGNCPHTISHSTVCYNSEGRMLKRVFKTKTFARWAKKVLGDELLCQAAREIERGEFDADLGQGVCKKRIALPGQGKSGSTRTLVAKQHASAIFFLAGREKSDPGKDFSVSEEEAAKAIGKALQAATVAKLETLKTDGVLKEIFHEQEYRCGQPCAA